MDTEQQQEYTYEGWQAGIADSPEQGFANMRNVNIERYPGAVTPGFQTVSTTPPAVADAAINLAGGNTINIITTNPNLYQGQAIVVNNTGGNLTAGQIYFLSYPVFFGTYWQAQVSSGLRESFVSTVVTLAAGITGTISFIPMGTIMDFKTYYPPSFNGTPITFCIDDKSRVWVQNNITGAGTITQAFNTWYYLPRTVTDGAIGNAYSQGLAIYKSLKTPSQSWLFAAWNNTLSVLRIDDFSLTGGIDNWTVTFTSFLTGAYHRGFVSQTGAMYFTDGSSIFGFSEVNGKTFSPSDNTTYSLNPSAILLPSYEVASCLDNLGDNLMVGGLNSNLIYPWNEIQQVITTASSTQVFASYQTPIRVGEKGIYQIKNINNTLYILAGTKGIVYYTSGYTVLPLKKIPEYLTGGMIQWGGIEKIDGNLLFGFLGTQSDSNSPVGGVGKIFLIEQATQQTVVAQGTFVIDQSTVTNPLTTLPTALNSFILPQPTGSNQALTIETYYIGSNSGVDVVSLGTSRTDGSAFVECQIEHASPIKTTRTFQSVGIELLQPLAYTQSVDVQYRTALNGTFVEINGNTPTFNTTNLNGTTTNAFDSTQIFNTNLVQLKIILTSDGGRNPILSSVQLQ